MVGKKQEHSKQQKEESMSYAMKLTPAAFGFGIILGLVVLDLTFDLQATSKDELAEFHSYYAHKARLELPGIALAPIVIIGTMLCVLTRLWTKRDPTSFATAVLALSAFAVFAVGILPLRTHIIALTPHDNTIELLDAVNLMTVFHMNVGALLVAATALQVEYYSENEALPPTTGGDAKAKTN